MSFLYPRTITVSRPGAQTGVGFQPVYAADTKDNETDVIASPGVAASIQLRREGQRSKTGLPGDTTDPIWWVFIPLEADVAPGTIIEKDVVTDDLGDRYTVVAPYWDSLGWRLSAERLQA